MASSMIGRDGNTRSRKQGEGGFSLLEVMISMVILTVGLVSLLGVFGLAMAATQSSQEDMIAKQLANEAYESIVTARNSSQLSWSQILNASSCGSGVNPSSGGIFLSGTTALYKAGADGIIGTCDDMVAGEQTLEEPGPDGNYGSTDDVMLPLTGYQRTITILPVTAGGVPVASIRSVTITVQYTTPQMNRQKTYTLNSYISQYQ
ncbi:MAG: prepilin-type N-terminal cleavage/methylation domain-containing protein [Terriglobales bacterium]